jgi:hypothetical protein
MPNTFLSRTGRPASIMGVSWFATTWHRWPAQWSNAWMMDHLPFHAAEPPAPPQSAGVANIVGNSATDTGGIELPPPQSASVPPRFDTGRKCLRHGEFACPSCLTYENTDLRAALAAAEKECEDQRKRADMAEKAADTFQAAIAEYLRGGGR